MRAALPLACLSLAGVVAALGAYPRPEVDHVIIDSDLMQIDDLAALQLTIALEEQSAGRMKLAAFVLDVPSKYSAMMAKALLSWYGRGDKDGDSKVPVGLRRPWDDFVWANQFEAQGMQTSFDFCKALGFDEFWKGRGWGDADLLTQTEAPLELYKRILRAAPGRSVTIMAIGFWDNIYELLKDDEGLQLFKDKVWRMAVLGGGIAVDPDTADDKLPKSWNFYGTQDGVHKQDGMAGRTAWVLDNWPDRRIAAYFSPSFYLDPQTRRQPIKYFASLDADPALANDPLRRARELHADAEWISDPPVAMFVADVAGRWFQNANAGGRIELVRQGDDHKKYPGQYDGSFRWTTRPRLSNEHRLRLRDERDAAKLGEAMDELQVGLARKYKRDSVAGW